MGKSQAPVSVEEQNNAPNLASAKEARKKRKRGDSVDISIPKYDFNFSTSIFYLTKLFHIFDVAKVSNFVNVSIFVNFLD